MTPAPPTVAPGVPANANTNPQQTGPIVLLEKTQYDLLGSNTKMDVTINPEAGSWDIIPQYTEWTWKAINVVPGPNNTTVEEVIGKGQGRGLEEYVYTNKKQFEITNLDILQNVKESIDDDVEFKKIDIIYFL